MNVIFGEVEGDTCPKCQTHLGIDGEFSEGDEFTCEGCGALLQISDIEATYTLSMGVVSEQEDEDYE